MGIATGNPTWEDFPSTNTPITADRLNSIETAIDGSMLGADDNYITDAEKAALHSHANKTALDAVSGVNTGDQTMPTWDTIAGKPAVVAAGADAAAARTAIGAGTSNLALGTTASTAKAGNYTPPSASATVQGIVELATTAETTTGTDTARAVTPAGVKAVADTKAAASHTHTLADVTDYTAPDLSGYATDAELTSGLSGKANATHSHAPADITGTAVITTDPRLSDARTPTAHSHAISDVTGLQTTLDGKQASGSYAPATHTHTAAQISDSTATGRSVLTAADAAAARTAIGAGTSSLTIGTTGTTAAAGNRQATTTATGMVELATTAETTTGTDTTRAVTPAGVAAAIAGVGVTDHGALNGLGDDDHPQYALADGTRGAFVSPAALTAGLADKADAAHSHAIAQVTGLQTALDGKQASGSYAAATHNHDDRYYTESETNALLAGKQAAGSYAAATHNHDGTYAPVLGADDNYVTDAEKAALHTHPAVIAQGDTAAAARAAIGAGTSDLVIGTTASTAKAGNYSPPAATATAQGIVELATPAEATTGTDTARAVTPQGLKAVADTKANVSHSHTAAQVTGLATVATTGAYTDLTGTPTIPDSPDDIGAAPATQPINARTGAYTLVASDAGKLVTVTAAAGVTVTVPASTFTAGQRVDVLDLGNGRVTFVAGSGMTLNGTPTLVSREKYSAHSVVFLSATQAVVVGDLA